MSITSQSPRMVASVVLAVCKRSFYAYANRNFLLAWCSKHFSKLIAAASLLFFTTCRSCATR